VERGGRTGDRALDHQPGAAHRTLDGHATGARGGGADQRRWRAGAAAARRPGARSPRRTSVVRAAFGRAEPRVHSGFIARASAWPATGSASGTALALTARARV